MGGERGDYGISCSTMERNRKNYLMELMDQTCWQFDFYRPVVWGAVTDCVTANQHVLYVKRTTRHLVAQLCCHVNLTNVTLANRQLTGRILFVILDQCWLQRTVWWKSLSGWNLWCIEYGQTSFIYNSIASIDSRTCWLLIYFNL